MPATEHTYSVVRIHPDPRVLRDRHGTFASAVETAGRLLAARCEARRPLQVAAHYRVVEIPPGEDYDYDGRVCAELRAEGYLA